MNKIKKAQIIEKFKNSIQKCADAFSKYILNDADLTQSIDVLTQNIKATEQLKSMAELNLNPDVRDEISSRVRTEIDEGYSELNNYIITQQNSENDFLKLKNACNKTKIGLQCIPDDIDRIFKDENLNYKQICACTGSEISKQNEENANASHQLLNNITERQQINTQANFQQKELKN